MRRSGVNEHVVRAKAVAREAVRARHDVALALTCERSVVISAWAWWWGRIRMVRVARLVAPLVAPLVARLVAPLVAPVVARLVARLVAPLVARLVDRPELPSARAPREPGWRDHPSQRLDARAPGENEGGWGRRQ